MNQTFSIPIRIYYEDTDSGGVVYYANYLRFMQRARTEWLRALGFEQDELLRNDGVLFAVRAARLDFLKPARFNDLLQASVALGRLGRASLTVQQRVQRGDLVLCEGEVRVACLAAATMTPCAMPARLAARLTEGGRI